MIELVPMAYRIVNEVDAVRDDGETRNVVARGGAGGTGSISVNGKSATPENTTGPVVVGNGSGGLNENMSRRRMDEDEERDAVFYRLDGLGYRVGQGLVER